MGLDCSHNAFHGAYSSFNRFRQFVSKSIGGSYPPHEDKSLNGAYWYLPDDMTSETHFMPREAARIFLKVTNVRVERLQDISEEDARAEGCITFHDKTGDGKFEDVLEFDLTARDAFCELWQRLNLKRGYGWETNPWVRVYEFERISKEEAERLEGLK